MELKQKEKNNGSNLHQPDVDTHTLSRRHKVQLLFNYKRWRRKCQSWWWISLPWPKKNEKSFSWCPVEARTRWLHQNEKFWIQCQAWWHHSGHSIHRLLWKCCQILRFHHFLTMDSFTPTSKAARWFPFSPTSIITFYLNSTSYNMHFIFSMMTYDDRPMLTFLEIKWNGWERRRKHASDK